MMRRREAPDKHLAFLSMPWPRGRSPSPLPLPPPPASMYVCLYVRPVHHKKILRTCPGGVSVFCFFPPQVYVTACLGIRPEAFSFSLVCFPVSRGLRRHLYLRGAYV